MGAALLYPLIVVAVAYGVFVFQVTRLAPVMSQACGGFDGRHELVPKRPGLAGRHGPLVGDPGPGGGRPVPGPLVAPHGPRGLVLAVGEHGRMEGSGGAAGFP